MSPCALLLLLLLPPPPCALLPLPLLLPYCDNNTVDAMPANSLRCMRRYSLSGQLELF